MYGCVHGTSKPSQSARFDGNTMFWFYIPNQSTHETREDSVISAPRTLEAHSRGLGRFSTLTYAWDSVLQNEWYICESTTEYR